MPRKEQRYRLVFKSPDGTIRKQPVNAVSEDEARSWATPLGKEKLVAVERASVIDNWF